MARPRPEMDPLLTPAETARVLQVDRRTVSRLARSGRLPAVRTLGGHRRFRERDVLSLRSTVKGPFRPAL